MQGGSIATFITPLTKSSGRDNYWETFCTLEPLNIGHLVEEVSFIQRYSMRQNHLYRKLLLIQRFLFITVIHYCTVILLPYTSK